MIQRYNPMDLVLAHINCLWFYAQIIEAVIVTDELDYLFDVLKWMLKSDLHVSLVKCISTT